MVFASNLGYPRIGSKRQLKKAVEDFWSGKSSESELFEVGKTLRIAAWKLQEEAGMDFIPSNDFSFYDHVLDTIAMVGALPKRFQWSNDNVDINTYFLMPRGTASVQPNESNSSGTKLEAQAMEMTKWFVTNYHFIVPELEEDQQFKLASRKPLDEYLEAKAAGIETRPVLLGPVTFLHLAKGQQLEKNTKLLERLLDVYLEILLELKTAGAQWVQLDEPCLSTDLDDGARMALELAYETLNTCGLPIMLTTYFSAMDKNLKTALNLPVQGIHLDLINGSRDLEYALSHLPASMLLSAGVIDGHNVWRCNLEKTINLVGDIAEKIGPERLVVAPSCSLMHVPMDLELETSIETEIKSLLSFAKQKVQEVSIITDGLCCGLTEIAQALNESNAVFERTSTSKFRHNPSVENQLDLITPEMSRRKAPFSTRFRKQQERFHLPPLATTTIGSFPQTKEIREARRQFRSGRIDKAQYEKAMQDEIANNITLQEKIGLDVLVHGEPERTDMVEYFADELSGMLVTQYGWVQSYGSRCVKPPVIYGNVSRPQPITVAWAKYAQSLTDKPVKGMLTGPLTMLQWSFVRDDQPREKTCLELALAIRDEVQDLESAGIKIIQIDEPAIREGLPMKKEEWSDYLRWSVKCFRLASSGVADDTQIHTHMCYSEFGDMVQAIADMDADVISIEAARSSMDLLSTLKEIQYPNAIGPGVYDIHSPRVPSEAEIEQLLQKALEVIDFDKLWVNPDCGLKTRNWQEVLPSLAALVKSALRLRKDAASVSQ
ncbi:MAG TPA: 5-methyltetrahydropteroyltriglutamate--homocysteine S-methyltransferase [Oculatellaceae cyanobacterium]